MVTTQNLLRFKRYDAVQGHLTIRIATSTNTLQITTKPYLVRVTK